MYALEEALHLGLDDLPWITSDDGSRFQIVYANPRDNVWVAHGLLAPGSRSPRHRHTGQVFSYTVEGAWHFLEYDFVMRAGSFLYERAGAVHTPHVLEDNTGMTDMWSHIVGAVLNLDDDDNVVSVDDAASMAAHYLTACEAAGHPRPNIIAG